MDIAHTEVGKRLYTVRAFIGLFSIEVGVLMGWFINSRFKGCPTELAQVLVVLFVDSAMAF